jgi:hypothetical protein
LSWHGGERRSHFTVDLTFSGARPDGSPADEIGDKLTGHQIVMRTYFEKPRTVVGWKGLISDPDLNGSYRVNHGMGILHRRVGVVNGAGADNHQQAAVFAVEDFFNSATGGRDGSWRS